MLCRQLLTRCLLVLLYIKISSAVVVYHCNHCSNWTLVVVEILVYGNRLRSTHCRELPDNQQIFFNIWLIIVYWYTLCGLKCSVAWNKDPGNLIWIRPSRKLDPDPTLEKKTGQRDSQYGFSDFIRIRNPILNTILRR